MWQQVFSVFIIITITDQRVFAPNPSMAFFHRPEEQASTTIFSLHLPEDSSIELSPCRDRRFAGGSGVLWDSFKTDLPFLRWASLKRPQERAKKLAKLVDCKEGEEMDKMVACLKDTPMFQLMNTHPNFYAWKHLQQTQEPVTAWSPRVDPESGMSFMPNEPIDLMTSGNFQHVPWITGITDDEGATRSYAFFEDMEGVREWEEKFAELGPLVFGLHDGQSEAPKVSTLTYNLVEPCNCNPDVGN